MKRHQIDWARSAGLIDEWRETGSGRPWVLRQEKQELNFHRPEWRHYIRGKEHRWSRAMNSSQCFAVNLFAPLADDGDLATQVFPDLFSTHPLEIGDSVQAEFEHTPVGARGWLGEQNQQTQIDVIMTAVRAGRARGHVLIEVKLTEAAIPYFLKRYQIEEKSSKKAPHQEPIVVLNRNEVTEVLPPHMRIPQNSIHNSDTAVITYASSLAVRVDARRTKIY
jgi:hypothetical protein